MEAEDPTARSASKGHNRYQGFELDSGRVAAAVG